MDIKEKYASCSFLEYGLHIASDGIRHCCYISKDYANQPCLSFNNAENMHDLLVRFINLKKQIIQDNINGVKTFCSGCPNLKDGEWAKNKSIKIIHIALDHTCNVKCRYCIRDADPNQKRNNKIEIIDLVKKLKSCSPLIDPECQINYTSGEISIQQNINEIINELRSFNLNIYSNATRYHSILLDIIKRIYNCMIINLDCGTKETYKKIKNIDLFDDVCRNIKEYSQNGGNVILKYIILDENSNKKDIDEFINICMENQVKGIVISRDLRYYGPPDKNITKAAMNLRYKAIKNNIPIIDTNLSEFRCESSCLYERNLQF